MKRKENFKMARDRSTYNKLQENAKQLTAKLLPIYRSKHEVNSEYEYTKNDVFTKLSDLNETLTLRELLYTTNANSNENVVAIEKLIKIEQRKQKQISTAFMNHEYINHMTPIGNPVHVDRLDIRFIELTTDYLKEQWEDTYKVVKQKTINYHTQVEQYKSVKHSFLEFVHLVMDTHKNLKQRHVFEKYKTRELNLKLKDCKYNSINIENQVLNLMNEIKVLEACYTLLTCLSPAEWKKQFKTDQLTNYEFTRSDVDLTRKSHQNYLNLMFNRTLTDYLKDVRLEPIPNMYWQSAEQFIQTLDKLKKKTTDRMLLFDMIRWRTSDSKRRGDLKRHKTQHINSKLNMLSGNDRIKNLSDEESSKFKNFKTVINDEEYFQILKMMAIICRQLNYLYVDFSMPLKMLEYITNCLDYIVLERNKIPNDQWERTDKILRLINKHQNKETKFKSLKCNVVQQAIKSEANKIYAKHTKRAMIITNRSNIPIQLPPKQPKIPTLKYEQQMYLKCFTYLSPKDVYNDPTIAIPEFKF